MSYQHILYEEKEHIGILTLNRPEKRNALGIQAELEMTHCLKSGRPRENRSGDHHQSRRGSLLLRS